MPSLIGFPFRLNNVGAVVTNEQNSDTQLGEELATLVGTRLGERVMSPSYGLTDFLFSEIDRSELELKISIFQMPITIKDINISYPTASTQSVIIEFDKDKRKAK
jgi:hypothetical protein